MKAVVEIDPGSGFCFGVVTAIEKAQDALTRESPLYCLGDIVHNSDEVDRLSRQGMVTITHDDLVDLPEGSSVLLRAHGEPPSTYAMAQDHGIRLIDATCPVVLKLQQRIKRAFDTYGCDRQIVIYGKPGHAEVNGLVGQTEGNAIVVRDENDLDLIDFGKPIELYSQTTKSLDGFRRIIYEIENRLADGVEFHYYDTICRQVANRVEKLRGFASEHDLVLVVSGMKSSNGRYLYEQCREVNDDTYLIPNADGVDSSWLVGKLRIGVCGATSTPRWLMEKVRERVNELMN